MEKTFLMWHQGFLSSYEEEFLKGTNLQGIPFWDFTKNDYHQPYKATIWGPNYLGGSVSNGADDAPCIADGIFAGVQTKYPTKDCIRRGFSMETGATNGFEMSKNSSVRFTSSLEIQELLRENDFQKFHDAIQYSVHAVPHVYIGGNLGTMKFLNQSPNDPVFYFHHTFIDSLWSRWRELHPTVKIPDADASLAGLNRTIKQVIDRDDQCVRYIHLNEDFSEFPEDPEDPEEESHRDSPSVSSSSIRSSRTSSSSTRSSTTLSKTTTTTPVAKVTTVSPSATLSGSPSRTPVDVKTSAKQTSTAASNRPSSVPESSARASSTSSTSAQRTASPTPSPIEDSPWDDFPNDDSLPSSLPIAPHFPKSNRRFHHRFPRSARRAHQSQEWTWRDVQRIAATRRAPLIPLSSQIFPRIPVAFQRQLPVDSSKFESSARHMRHISDFVEKSVVNKNADIVMALLTGNFSLTLTDEKSPVPESTFPPSERRESSGSIKYLSYSAFISPWIISLLCLWVF
jgi:hypothetical protein